jgi:hypothetical protein
MSASETMLWHSGLIAQFNLALYFFSVYIWYIGVFMAYIYSLWRTYMHLFLFCMHKLSATKLAFPQITLAYPRILTSASSVHKYIAVYLPLFEYVYVYGCNNSEIFKLFREIFVICQVISRNKQTTTTYLNLSLKLGFGDQDILPVV